jgi:hypothetical protein
VLEYVVPSKTDSVLHSTGWFADSLSWKWVSYRSAQAGGRQRFCVHSFLVGVGLPRCLQLSLCGWLLLVMLQTN